MGTVEQLRDSVEARMAAVAGSEYSLLGNMTEIEKNAFKGANNRYGVVPREMNEVDGTTCFLTIDQNFELVLTNGFFSNVTASDLDKRNKTIVLQDLMLDIYKDLKSSKAGRPDIVMHTLDLNIQDPEFLEEDHVVILRAIITIKYRSLL